ncbi:MAG: glycosyltransferase [Desulfobacterales bacterium]|nr:MAG: glycosyltransferase [Desulfobacterales bacterium]
MGKLDILTTHEGEVLKVENKGKPFASIVIPAYNEEALIESNLIRLYGYLETLNDEFDWEIIIVNDGSMDRTGEIAENFAKLHDGVYVLHHFVNFHIGQCFRFAFNHCRGDYVVTMDLDLSYSPDHIGRLLRTIRHTRAKVVIASPYMKGGKITNIPWFRRKCSIWANRFLSLSAQGKISTLTGMVRAYDRRFIASLNLKAMDYEINPEIIYKAQLLRARIIEIPAHLDWSFQKSTGKARKSSMRVTRGVVSNLLSGFIFRPFMFFIIPGLVLLVPNIYMLWLIIKYTVNNLLTLPDSFGPLNYRIGAAVAKAFEIAPHTFIVTGISLLVAIQLISLGILSLQSKRYFEELFHLGSNIYKHLREDKITKENRSS